MSDYRIIRPPIKPRFCLFVPWTRIEWADKILDQINAMYLPREEMEVVFYVDTNDKALWERLNHWAILNQFVYNGITMVKSGNEAPPDYDGSIPTLSNSIPRRSRIVAMKEDSKKYISASELVFGLEDDTYVQPGAFEILFEQFEDPDKKVGMAMGVQQGRWGLGVLGAWRLDDINDPKLMKTMPFEHETDAVEIDGGGYFCYMTTVELYKAHKYHWHDECFGPDATFGIELRKKGYKCLMDFRIICDHYTPQGVLIPSPQNVINAEWRKVADRWIKEDTDG